MKFKEDDLLIQCMTYLKVQYPNIVAFHVPNERKTSPQAGARLKRKGVMAGVADILILNGWLYSQHNLFGIAIELKIHPNKQTDSQKEFEYNVKRCEWAYHVIYDFDTFKKTVDRYFKI